MIRKTILKCSQLICRFVQMWLLFVCLIVGGVGNQTLADETQTNQTLTKKASSGESLTGSIKLLERGRTLVEAEDYSRASRKFPYAENCETCSGKENLGFFWRNSWFELKLNVPRMLNYRMMLRTAARTSTKVEVQLVDAAGLGKKLTTIDVPKTGSWKTYASTREAIISLPAGVQTLRFKSLVDCSNIDYITFSAGASEDVVVSRPDAGPGPNINPLKGFSSSWWRKNEPHASVGIQGLEWGELEPQDDVFDWTAVEKVFDRDGTRGRHVILQFIVDWDNRKTVAENYAGPDWLLQKVGEEVGPADPDDTSSRPMRATNYNSPVFMEEANEAIKALLEHYRDDPRTFVLQVGVLGFGGEWHTFPREDWAPTKFTKSAILNTYMQNLGPDDLTQVRYPDEPINVPQRRMGYTNGSATPTPHGYQFGEAIAKGQLWKNGPVGGVWPQGVEAKMYERFFQTPEGDFFLKQGGYSTMTPPEHKDIMKALPDWKPDERYMQMHRQMGYNFQAKFVRHLVSVDDSGQTHIEVELQNTGIAPFYKNWDLQLAVLETATGDVCGDVVETDFDLRTLAPGESITIRGSSTATLDQQKNYQIGLRILQPGADKPKTSAWGLDARNTYVVLANKIKVTEGSWGEDVLQGGWNILVDVERRIPIASKPLGKGQFFPFDGSFRRRSKR